MLQALHDERLARAGVSLSLRRLDRLSGVLSGNKYYKLGENLRRAQAAGVTRVASFGGAWSNHLHALAQAGHAFNVKTLGLVRADADAPLTAMLEDAQRWGMQLHFLSRSDYRRRHNPEFITELARAYPDTWWVPEGGSNPEGVAGCVALGREIAANLPPGEVAVALACGTGGTLAGVAAGLTDETAVCRRVQVYGYPMVKGDFYPRTIRDLLRRAGLEADNWSVEEGAVSERYGSCSPALAAFICDFYKRHRVVLEPVYTGKLLYALYQQAESGRWRGQHLPCIPAVCRAFAVTRPYWLTLPKWGLRVCSRGLRTFGLAATILPVSKC